MFVCLATRRSVMLVSVRVPSNMTFGTCIARKVFVKSLDWFIRIRNASGMNQIDQNDTGY